MENMLIYFFCDPVSQKGICRFFIFFTDKSRPSCKV